MNAIVEKRLCLILIGSLTVLLILMLIMAAVPPVSRDALTHHLALPKLWIDNGAIYETPDIIFSYYPMNLDLLYVIPLLAGNDILPKYIHMAFGLATAILVFLYLNARLARSYALTGFLLFLSLPVIVKLSITVYVDLGLIFFSTAALLLLLEWQRGGGRSRYLLLGSAVSCGLALGTKYNALGVAILLGLMTPFVSLQARRLANDSDTVSVTRRALLDGLIFAGVAFIVFAPWMLRNLVWTGNPLYPLYDGLFNPHTPQETSSLHPLIIRKLVYGESLWETILIPLRIFLQGQDDVPALFDGRLNPGLLIFPLMNLWPRRGTSHAYRLEKQLLAVFAVVYILIVFFTRDMRIRYMVPAVPPLVILSVYGLHHFFGQIDRLSGNTLRGSLYAGGIALILGCLIWNGAYIEGLFNKVRPLAYLGGAQTREVYIESFRPEYPAIQYLNQSAKADNQVAGVFLGNRRYYFKKDPLLFDWPAFKAKLEAAEDDADLAYDLRSQGITHLIIGGQRLQEWSQRSLTVQNQRKLKDFLANQLKIQFNKNGYFVFQL